MNINEKAVAYGTCDLQQIEKIDRLISEAREEAIEEYIASLPNISSTAECDEEYGYNRGVRECKESLLNLKKK